MTALLATAMLASAVFGQAQADEPDADTVSAAAEAGVDVVSLLGAMNTTGLDARPYLLAVHELAPTAPSYGIWDRVAACESGGNWAANTGNGFAGGLQFAPGTWRAYGGVGVAWQASRAQQISVAERVLAVEGWNAWPVCSQRLGLR